MPLIIPLVCDRPSATLRCVDHIDTKSYNLKRGLRNVMAVSESKNNICTVDPTFNPVLGKGENTL